MGLFQDIKVKCMCLHKPRRCAMHALSMIFSSIQNCAVHREDSTQTSTSQELSHQTNKTYRKSLQWSEKRLPYLQAFKKEFDSLTAGRRQEETEDLSDKNKKKTSSFQVQVTMNDKLNRMELSQGSTWWELALQIASRSLRMEKCLQEIHTPTDTYSDLVITHGSTQRKNVQREEEHLT